MPTPIAYARVAIDSGARAAVRGSFCDTRGCSEGTMLRMLLAPA